MRSGKDLGTVAPGHGETNRVGDNTLVEQLVGPHEPRQDRQPGCPRPCPLGGPRAGRWSVRYWRPAWRSWPPLAHWCSSGSKDCRQERVGCPAAWALFVLQALPGISGAVVSGCGDEKMRRTPV